MADFNFHLNRQGPQGVQGIQGEPGFSPNIIVDTNTAAEYKLLITTESGSFVTDNLRGSAVDDQGGTYMRYDPETQGMYAGDADMATSTTYGTVMIASDEDADAGIGIGVVSAEQMADYVSTAVSGITAGDGEITLVQGANTLGSFTVNQSTPTTISIPTASSPNDGVLTIQRNGRTLSSFSANSSTSVTVNIDVPTDTEDLTNSAGFLSAVDLADVAISGSYNDLINKPVIPTVPTNVSAFTNDAGYLVSSDLAGYVQSTTLATVATTGSYADLLNKPTIPSVANDGTLSIYQEGVLKGTFTADQAGNTTINLTDGGSSIETSTTLTSSSTDDTVPTSKTVYDFVENEISGIQEPVVTNGVGIYVTTTATTTGATRYTVGGLNPTASTRGMIRIDDDTIKFVQSGGSDTDIIKVNTSTTLTSSSTHGEVPTSKTVYDALQSVNVSPATTTTLGTVQPDNTTIVVDNNGVISTSSTIPTTSTMSTAITAATSTMVTSSTVSSIVTLTQAEYDALTTPDANTFYSITNAPATALADLSNCTRPYITESYVNGTSGYNVYSNGYCEQWGRVNISSSTAQTITLLKPYADSNFNVVASSAADICYGRASVVSASQISVNGRGHDYSAQSPIVYWLCKGYVSVS